MIMQTLEKPQSLPKTVEAGLRILAKIIARQAVKVQFANRDGVDPDGLPLSSLHIQATTDGMPRGALLGSEDGWEQ